jgi:hypothetical protein
MEDHDHKVPQWLVCYKTLVENLKHVITLIQMCDCGGATSKTYFK